MSSVDPQSRPFRESDGLRAVRSRRRSVLVTGAASPSGKSLAQQLVGRGLQVHCVDTRPMDVVSAACHLIAADDGFTPALVRLVRAEGIDLVIPANAPNLTALAHGRMALHGVDVVMPGAGPIATAQDRLLTAWSLWSHGVRVPDFGVPSDFARPTGDGPQLGGSLVLRSRRADAEQTTMLVEDAEEVDWASLSDDMLVQEFVRGTTYKAVVYRPLDGKGRFTTMLKETILDDGESAATYAVETAPLPDVERVAQAAVRALGLTGAVEVSLRCRAGLMPVVLDVRAGFGPHSHLVPELLDAVLRDHPPQQAAGSARARVNGAETDGFTVRSGGAFLAGAQL